MTLDCPNQANQFLPDILLYHMDDDAQRPITTTQRRCSGDAHMPLSRAMLSAP